MGLVLRCNSLHRETPLREGVGIRVIALWPEHHHDGNSLIAGELQRGCNSCRIKSCHRTACNTEIGGGSKAKAERDHGLLGTPVIEVILTQMAEKTRNSLREDRVFDRISFEEFVQSRLRIRPCRKTKYLK